MVVCEGVKGEGKCLFPSPFKRFVYCKYLVISVLRVKVACVLIEESKDRRNRRKGEGEC